MPKTGADFVLCSFPRKYTVSDVRSLLSRADQDASAALVEVIQHRLRERYLTPLAKIPPEDRSGFLMMATACLLIEAMESFRLGIDDTKRKSRKIFIDFFAREAARFPGLASPDADFYRHVRCGVLHQAEAKGGYRIVRNGPLVSGDRAINAQRFVEALSACLDDYLARLSTSLPTEEIWLKARQKLSFICDNCCS